MAKKIDLGSSLLDYKGSVFGSDLKQQDRNKFVGFANQFLDKFMSDFLINIPATQKKEYITTNLNNETFNNKMYEANQEQKLRNVTQRQKEIDLINSSENRTEGESDILINRKIKSALKNNFKIIFCIGESLKQRQKKQTHLTLSSQIKQGLKSKPIQYTKNIKKNYQRVSLSGEYIFGEQIYLYSLNEKGNPGFDVLTPFETKNKEYVLINRGWIKKEFKNDSKINTISNNINGLLRKANKKNLFTPDNDWFLEHDIPPQFVNVVEDARIEKLMKRKYPGLAKTFFGGYKEMNENDFFDLSGEDVSSMNLADRVNLYFKVGNFVDINFDDQKEMPLVHTIAECETFEDVLIAAETLYKHCKKEIDNDDRPDAPIPPQENFESESSQQNSETLDSQDSENSDSEDESQDSIENNSQVTPGSNAGDNDELEVTTANNLEEKLKDLIDQRSGDNVYAEIPKLDSQNLIAKNSDVHDVINEWFTLVQRTSNQRAKSHGMDGIDLYSVVDQLFYDFKKSAQKEVNYLVKEFECKKAADSYARASTSRTGVLDTAKLHTYRYNEDLFKKVTVLPDGKNHGLIFVLDWSGSMSNVLRDTCKQLFNLIWFCKKVSIPFEVYAFTNEWKRSHYSHKLEKYVDADLTPSYKKKEGFLSIDDSFSMMNIFTSKVPAKEIEKQMINIWRIAC